MFTDHSLFGFADSSCIHSNKVCRKSEDDGEDYMRQITLSNVAKQLIQCFTDIPDHFFISVYGLGCLEWKT